MTEISNLGQDLQASAPEIRLSLTRAGVTGVRKALRVSHEGHQTVMTAEIECTVDLSREQKGVHMSRFPELFEEAIEEVVGTEALHVEALAEHIARHIVGRQRAKAFELLLDKALTDKDVASSLLLENNPANRAALARKAKGWLGNEASTFVNLMNEEDDDTKREFMEKIDGR